MENMRVASVQFNHTAGDKAHNMSKVLAETWKARDEMIVADLEASLLHMCTGQRWIRSRRPDLYNPLVVPTGREEDTRKVRFERK